MHAPLPRVLVEQRDAIGALCRQFGVERLEVFGSAADGRFDAQRSDVDFIVRFGPEASGTLARRFVGLQDALAATLGRRVDLLSDRPIGNPYLKRAVDASRREIYVRLTAEAPA